MTMTTDQIKEFLRAQIPPGARRPSLIFAMQVAAQEELKRMGVPEVEALRSAVDRLRRAAEDAGAKPMGLAAVQASAPSLIDQMLRMLD